MISTAPAGTKYSLIKRETHREREYNKVLACLGLKPFSKFYSKFSLILGLFQGLPSIHIIYTALLWSPPAVTKYISVLWSPPAVTIYMLPMKMTELYLQ